MRFVLPFAALLLAACPSYNPYLPDGGRARVNCDTGTVLKVPVTILDRAGDPFPGAVLAVEYTSYNESENVIADSKGVALVEDKHGPGVARVQGHVNDLRTQFAEITFNGTECSAAVSPQQVTLQLQ